MRIGLRLLFEDTDMTGTGVIPCRVAKYKNTAPLRVEDFGGGIEQDMTAAATDRVIGDVLSQGLYCFVPMICQFRCLVIANSLYKRVAEYQVRRLSFCV